MLSADAPDIVPVAIRWLYIILAVCSLTLSSKNCLPVYVTSLSGMHIVTLVCARGMYTYISFYNIYIYIYICTSSLGTVASIDPSSELCSNPHNGYNDSPLY